MVSRYAPRVVTAMLISLTLDLLSRGYHNPAVYLLDLRTGPM